MAWAIEDERVGSDGDLYMVLPCRRHATRSTWAATAQACPFCPAQDPQPGGEAPRALTLDLRCAYDEARRHAMVEILGALHIAVPAEMSISRCAVALVIRTDAIDAVLAALSGGELGRGHPPLVVAEAALLAMGLPDVDPEH